MTWQGRQLARASKDGKSLKFTYDSEGIRTSKTVDGIKTEYFLNGTQILAEKTGNEKLFFFYDQQGNRVGMADGSNNFYYYLYNIQGDVVALADASTGKLAATYTYDAWGKLMELKDTAANSVGTLNPFRYRGYYYDQETQLYYLQSRYYDAETGRFINADAFATTDISTPLSTNMFAYCENNPVMRSDTTGNIWGKAATIAVGAAIGGIVSAVCTSSHGGSFREVACAFASGVLEGAISSAGAVGKAIIVSIESANAVYKCRKAGASWGESILAGVMTAYSSFFYVSSGSLAANAVCDLTLGLGTSLLSTGVTKQIIEKNKPKPTKKSTTKKSTIRYYSGKNSGSNYKKQYRFATGPR